MRTIILGLSLAVAATYALPGGAAADPSAFDLKGTWAADGACTDAATFVEFDGQDMLGSDARVTKARVGADYAVAVYDNRLIVSVTDLRSHTRDHLTFLVDDADAMRLDSSFVRLKLTRCPTQPRHLAAKP